ncbi:EcsC family protein [Acidocella sp.]|uniref:EcsC family protein n=1 Tax=Acidocella sp. TaxID=50710 RepID=UPI0026030BEA|nr:EcsC family protein [Acidocella sp.]
MSVSGPLPAHLAQEAAFLTPHERDRLWRAALTMADSRGLLLRFSALFGRRIERLRQTLTTTGARLGGENWAALTMRAERLIEDTLWSSFGLACFGLEAEAPRIPVSNFSNAARRAATAASGAASGFIGLPGVLFDIPFTTTTILRSIALTARAAGEDLSREDTRRACLEVLAFGAPGQDDDDAETGYWATRLGVNHLTLNLFIKSVAGRFGVVLSERLLAQAVPVAGALSGAALNYAFTDYYQKMAGVHFTLRALERRSGDQARLRALFGHMLVAAKARKRVKRPAEPSPIIEALPPG